MFIDNVLSCLSNFYNAKILRMHGKMVWQGANLSRNLL